MDIIFFKGGIGNQLFQYSFTLFMKKNFDRNLLISPLLLNLRIPDVTPRDFYLDKLFQKNELVSNSKASIHYFLSNFLKSKYYKLNDTNYNELNKLDGKNLIVEGFFQNVKIVDSVRDNLLKKLSSFNFLNKIFEKNDTKYICLHVRRGDYSNHGKTKEFHGLTKFSYYINGLKYLRSIGLNYPVKLITDSQNEVLNLKTILQNLEFEVDLVKGNEFEHLILMSQASGVVMSNSSFSWWGGYLALNLRSSVIIYPDPWFTQENFIEQKLFDDRWIRLQREFDQ